MEDQELMRGAAAALLLATPVAAGAQVAPPSAVRADPALTAKAAALVALLDGRGDYDAYFAQSFRLAVSRERFAPVLDQLRAALGRPQRIESLAPLTAFSADLVIGYARGTATMRLALDPAPPHAATGLLVTGTAMRDDGPASLDADVRALPGEAGYGIYRLGDGAPERIAGKDDAAPAPLGSAFKLWVLAEAVRQVAAGERHWADVVPTGARSLPSGILQGWPAGTPVTLQTLATLMISISDNTATDTLMAALGRHAVDAQAKAMGGAVPVPTTREAFVLKADAALRARWIAASAGERAALLAREAPRFAAAPIDPGMFSGKPVAIDSVEWFASPAAMAATLDTLRRDPVARAILGINAGVDAATAARFGYVGFKGGSEPGVLSLNYVAQARDGRWYAMTGAWHRSDALVEELRFAGLMSRALVLAIGK